MAGGCASARIDHVGVGVEVDDLAVLLYIMEKFWVIVKSVGKRSLSFSKEGKVVIIQFLNFTLNHADLGRGHLEKRK